MVVVSFMRIAVFEEKKGAFWEIFNIACGVGYVTG
jgi:hypothetical protein